MICAGGVVAVLMATPVTYRSGPSTAGSVAERAASKGGVNRDASRSNASKAASGRLVLSAAMATMITMRAMSHQTMTWRYGYRSAIETSTDPPSSHGAKLIAKAAALAAIEPVRSKTIAVMAARAM